MKRIYADAAATTAVSERAWFEMKRAALAYPGNPSSAHEEGRKARAKLEECRARCAACLDCDPNEIVFTSGATEGNVTVRNACHGGYYRAVSEIEHPSNRPDEKIDFIIPVNPDGIVINWERFTDSNEMISVMTANNEIGTIQPVKEIASYCRSKGILFHTDSTAAVGHIPVSFRDIGADFLTLSAHKFHGPRGAGILVVRNGTDFAPLLTGGSQERGRRAGTENLPAIAGMTAALEDAVINLDANQTKVTAMRDRLIEGLLGIEGSHLNGDPVQRVPGIVNVRFDGTEIAEGKLERDRVGAIEGESLLIYLDAHGIAASAGSACHTGTSEPSHVLLALGLTPEQAHSAVRFSIDETNTPEEIETIIEMTRKGVEHIRSHRLN